MRNYLLGTFYSSEKLSKKRYVRYTLYPEFVIPGLRQIQYGLCRYIGYSLYPVCVKWSLRQKNRKGGPFCNIEKVKKRHIRNSLNPVWGKSGMSCVIVEGDSPQH